MMCVLNFEAWYSYAVFTQFCEDIHLVVAHQDIEKCPKNKSTPFKRKRRHDSWHTYMGVPKNRGTPKWMVYNEKPYQNGWFGVKTPYFRKHPYRRNYHIKAQQPSGTSHTCTPSATPAATACCAKWETSSHIRSSSPRQGFLRCMALSGYVPSPVNKTAARMIWDRKLNYLIDMYI